MMGGDSDENFDWDSEDDREVGLSSPPILGSSPPILGPPPPPPQAPASTTEASSSTSRSSSILTAHFVGMGFPINLVDEAIKENGEENTDSILETLLTYSAIKESPEEAQTDVDSDSDPCRFSSSSCSEYDATFLDDSDTDSSEKEEIVTLAKMGYNEEEIADALERCGSQASIVELIEFIGAAQMAKAFDAPEQKPRIKHLDDPYYSKQKKKLKLVHGDDDEMVVLPNPMIGFGLPTDSAILTRRPLPESANAPPYFYYENVALAPKGVWQQISSFLYEVKPEFVDSKHFCAAARKRGYIHNLPIHNRFPPAPLPPQTIHEALPLTKKWWPSWDPRTKLNCLQTVTASSRLTEKIRKMVAGHEGEPPLHVQKFVLNECRKWNLVWVGKNKVAPLEPDEVEMLLGFPKNHTRGVTRTDRYKSLGNSFQIDTVAYHLSVLKKLFPGGINLLSLFSGIGGAEVALHRLGIRLKNVVSVEKSEVNRNIVRCWWDQTNQTGNLIDIEDVQDLQEDRLEQLINMFGGFDLIVGGSPCNNLAGSNRLHRDGLEGKESSLFYDYWRILEAVKRIMKNNARGSY